MKSSPPFVLFTDAPPLQENGHGCHVLAKNLLQALPDQFGLVVTRLLRADLTRTRIRRGVVPPVAFYLDASARWLRRCPAWPRALLELGLFLLALPLLAVRTRRSGCRRLFALCGADPWFLLQADLLRRASGLPLDIYLVDDLEASCLLRGQRLLARWTRRFEPFVLRRANRVFVISPGYGEHLAQKYGVSSHWLPVPTEDAPASYTPFQPSVPDLRAITFLGSINELYLDGLCDLYAEIKHWNHRSAPPYQLRLRVFTRHEPRALLARLPDREFLELRLDTDTTTMQAGLRAAWAIFLPYSFTPEMRLMVSTSFSHKFTESVAAGRPLLVYGPGYASLPRYLAEEGLPLCVRNMSGLAGALAQIAASDEPGLTARYQALVARHHSPAALRRRLVADPP